MDASVELMDHEYRTLVEQAPLLIWRANLTMACDYFNARWLAFTGRSMAQEQGTGWTEGVHPDDFDRCLKIYTEAFAEKRIFEMEYRLKRADGVYRWLFDRGVPFQDEAGRFAGYIGSCVDVSERVDAQERLKAHQAAELERLQNLLPICAWCRHVRADNGYWEELEEYIVEHSMAKFSHGICPGCQSRFFPQTVAKRVPSGKQENK